MIATVDIGTNLTVVLLVAVVLAFLVAVAAVGAKRRRDDLAYGRTYSDGPQEKQDAATDDPAWG